MLKKITKCGIICNSYVNCDFRQRYYKNKSIDVKSISKLQDKSLYKNSRPPCSLVKHNSDTIFINNKISRVCNHEIFKNCVGNRNKIDVICRG